MSVLCRSVMSDSVTVWTVAHQTALSMESPGKNTGVGCHALLQGVFPNQESKLGLPHCRQILYQLSHQGSPRILEWVAYPFSRGSSWPQESNRGLLHCRWILYQLGHQGSPKSLSLLNHLQLFVTPWTVARQAPLSMGFSRQDYWNG